MDMALVSYLRHQRSDCQRADTLRQRSDVGGQRFTNSKSVSGWNAGKLERWKAACSLLSYSLLHALRS